MSQKESIKKPFWAIWMFYLFIAFEIIYMISPFGIYYYSVYGKGLNFLNDHSITAWLSSFFLPHIVETSSMLLNLYKDIGWILAMIGFVGFLIGAGQIYYYKFAQKGAVTGGIYNMIRHPQYASLAMGSFGLLLAWPRYLVLIVFITMLFVYYFLTRIEENECEEKFGQSYTEYRNRTPMFLPFTVPLTEKLLHLPRSGIKRYLAILALYSLAIVGAIGGANGLKSYSVGKLYSLYSFNSATISVAEIERDTLKKVMEIALSEREVQKRLEAVKGGSEAKFLNYVLPFEWYFSDIPMNIPEGMHGHHHPDHYNTNLYKIIFTQAELKTHRRVEGKALILNTVKRYPIVEVTVDVSQHRATTVENPPANVRWGDIPTPLF
jgi:protein-S-isoprenylcysteine O-methyltransferase Ste14